LQIFNRQVTTLLPLSILLPILVEPFSNLIDFPIPLSLPINSLPLLPYLLLPSFPTPLSLPIYPLSLSSDTEYFRINFPNGPVVGQSEEKLGL